ncbi:MAG TPA: hypothetical protein VF988_15055, partial [Verrucomicrobiae bacterium]
MRSNTIGEYCLRPGQKVCEHDDEDEDEGREIRLRLASAGPVTLELATGKSPEPAGWKACAT